MKFKKGQKKSILKGVSRLKVKDLDTGTFLVSFKHLDKNQGQKLHEWERESILADAINVLYGYCQSKLETQFDSKFTKYGQFPPSKKTEFFHPNHVPEDAIWARIHIKGKQCLIGHIIKNVFYLVFLDSEHKFWISEKKHT